VDTDRRQSIVARFYRRMLDSSVLIEGGSYSEVDAQSFPALTLNRAVGLVVRVYGHD
jgi:hypothetical protein